MHSSDCVFLNHFRVIDDFVTGLKWLVLLGALVVLLSSCASLSEDECAYMSWHARGVMDGTEGEPASQIYDYQATCERYNIRVDANAYEEGRREGVAHFCTRENGFNLGMSGRTYKRACTPDNEDLFLSGYEPGSYMYSAWRQLRTARQEKYQRELTVEEAERKITKLTTEIRSGELSNEEKDRRQAEIREERTRLKEASVSIGYWQARIPQLLTQCIEAKGQVERRGFRVNFSCY